MNEQQNKHTEPAQQPKSNAPLAIEPYDREWGIGVSGLTETPSPFPRINKMLEWIKNRDSTADSQRAMIVTECFEKYAEYPQNIKLAMIFRDILTRVKISIGEDELIVGELAAPPKHAPIYPEFSLNWLCDDIVNSPLENRRNDRYVLSEETKKAILGMRDDWSGKTVSEAIIAGYSPQERAGSHLEKGVVLDALFVYAGIGHVCIDYEGLFREGFGGIRRRAEAAAAKLDSSNPADLGKSEFYQAELIALEGASAYIARYGELAAEMAARETDQVRKRELERVSSNCLRVSTKPPRDFWEAIQLWHIATNMVIIETNGHSVTYGRFDKLFGGFYKNDIERGTLTRAFMQELIELAFLKMHELAKIREKSAIVFSSGTIMGGTALDVGGVDEQGDDVTCDVWYMVLDAHAHTRIPNPWMAVRLHENTPDEFMAKVFNVIRIGTGEPKIFNDAPYIESLLSYGRTLEDARNYVGVGCVEPSVPGKTYGWHDSGSVNLAKILQLAFNGGKCVGCDKTCKIYAKCAGADRTLSPNTGSLETFTSFGELLDSYDKQMKYWCDTLITLINKNDLVHQRLKPLPYLSLLIEGCIENGADVTTGSAVYNASGPQGVGIGTAADSLSVIKQLVFDEKRVTGAELLGALNADWFGAETLYALVNSDRMHHYGNDDDYADDCARFVMSELLQVH